MFAWEEIERILEFSYSFDKETSRAEQQATQDKVFRNSEPSMFRTTILAKIMWDKPAECTASL